MARSHNAQSHSSNSYSPGSFSDLLYSYVGVSPRKSSSSSVNQNSKRSLYYAGESKNTERHPSSRLGKGLPSASKDDCLRDLLENNQSVYVKQQEILKLKKELNVNNEKVIIEAEKQLAVLIQQQSELKLLVSKIGTKNFEQHELTRSVDRKVSLQKMLNFGHSYEHSNIEMRTIDELTSPTIITGEGKEDIAVIKIYQAELFRSRLNDEKLNFDYICSQLRDDLEKTCSLATHEIACLKSWQCNKDHIQKCRKYYINLIALSKVRHLISERHSYLVQKRIMHISEYIESLPKNAIFAPADLKTPVDELFASDSLIQSWTKEIKKFQKLTEKYEVQYKSSQTNAQAMKTFHEKKKLLQELLDTCPIFPTETKEATLKSNSLKYSDLWSGPANQRRSSASSNISRRELLAFLTTNPHESQTGKRQLFAENSQTSVVVDQYPHGYLSDLANNKSDTISKSSNNNTKQNKKKSLFDVSADVSLTSSGFISAMETDLEPLFLKPTYQSDLGHSDYTESHFAYSDENKDIHCNETLKDNDNDTNANLQIADIIDGKRLDIFTKNFMDSRSVEGKRIGTFIRSLPNSTCSANDIKSFVNLFSDKLAEKFQVTHENYNSLHLLVERMIYFELETVMASIIFTIDEKVTKRKDLSSLDRSCIKAMIACKKIICSFTITESYVPAYEVLAEIQYFFAPTDILVGLEIAFQIIVEQAESQRKEHVTAELLFPIVIWCLIMSEIVNGNKLVDFLSNHVDERLLLGASGYCLATFEGAMMHISNEMKTSKGLDHLLKCWKKEKLIIGSP